MTDQEKEYIELLPKFLCVRDKNDLHSKEKAFLQIIQLRDERLELLKNEIKLIWEEVRAIANYIYE